MRPVLLLPVILLAGCLEPVTLQYDHGRSYSEAMARQADLSRPSAAGSAYGLEANEALAIRSAAEAATTDAETATPEATVAKP